MEHFNGNSEMNPKHLGVIGLLIKHVVVTRLMRLTDGLTNYLWSPHAYSISFKKHN